MDCSQKMIKIKYGDTLKRIKTYVGANGKPELCMADLRNKIHDLFKLSADSEFILTYVDEDGDVITLSADDELEDALEQSMKFVMVTVELSNNNKGVNSYAQMQHPCPKIKTSVLSEFSKSVLQMLHEEIQLLLLKFSEDEISKGVADAVLAELVNVISKMAQSYLMINLDSQTHSTVSKEDDSDNNNKGVNSYAQIQYPCPKIKTVVLSESSKSALQRIWEALIQQLPKYLGYGIFKDVAGRVLAMLVNIKIKAPSSLKINLEWFTNLLYYVIRPHLKLAQI